MEYHQADIKDYSYAYRVNSMEDVLDLKRFKKRPFVDYKTLLNMDSEEEAMKVVESVFISFLGKMADDLIENNNFFAFPYFGFGYIKISNIADLNSDDYVYDIESDGKVWGPKLKLNKGFVQKTKKHYKLKFNDKFQGKIDQLVKNGHKYN